MCKALTILNRRQNTIFTILTYSATRKICSLKVAKRELMSISRKTVEIRKLARLTWIF